MNKILRNVLIIFLLLVFFGGGSLLGWAALHRLRQHNQSIILELNLEKRVIEDTGGNPLEQIGVGDRPKLQELIAGLEAAARDDRVKLLITTLGNGTMGIAQRQDLREAIANFRRSGKKAYAFSETFGEFSGGTGNYYLATAFDQIFLQPSGDIGLTGMLAEPMFLRGALDKLQIVPRGGQRYQEFTDKVVTGRKLQKERVLEIAKGRVWSGEDAKRLGLVDEVGSFQRAVAVAKELSGIPTKENVKLMRYPKPKSIFDLLRGKRPENSKDVLLRSLVEAIAPLRSSVRALSRMNEPPGANVVALPLNDWQD